MGFRAFTDRSGVQWEVYEIVTPVATRRPGTPQLAGATNQQPLMSTWLCFESATEIRRLSPIPEDWQTISDHGLTQLLDSARSVPKEQPR